MSLYKQYHSEINKMFEWDEILSECQFNQFQDEDDNTIGSCYLGSLINPSGKYYMPFACSNLDTCVSCKGTGTNRIKKDICRLCNGTGKRLIDDLKQFPTILEWIKKDNIPVHSGWFGENYIDCNLCQGTGKISTSCKQCGGLGSNEVYKDQEFDTALDDIAEAHGGYITYGEGAPCDTFFCMSIKNSQGEEGLE
jgi:hypothetical protein